MHYHPVQKFIKKISANKIDKKIKLRCQPTKNKMSF